MADHDPERAAKSRASTTHSSTSGFDSSSDSSESIETYSERTSLLAPGPSPDYKSTALVSSQEEPVVAQDEEPLLETEPKSVIAIISLLMIGMVQLPKSDSKV